MSSLWINRHSADIVAAAILGVLLFCGYLYYVGSSPERELISTTRLKRRNAELSGRASILSYEMDLAGNLLLPLELRDENVYRPIFAMNSIPSTVRNSDLGNTALYEELAAGDRSGRVLGLRRKADALIKRAYVQTKSLDEVEIMLRNADQMATSIPAICPVLPDKGKFRISSSFGRRFHPITHIWRMHSGIDFSMDKGTPVYATGDAVVENIKMEIRGYGRQVLLNHGFGYKTRYAHLDKVFVAEGMKVRRGEQIATSGNTGLSSGPHLHYEVQYMGRCFNPIHYFDWDITLEQYEGMLSSGGAPTDEFYVHPMHRGKGK